MAKSGVFEADPTVVARVTELKKELKKLAKAIVDEEDYSVEMVDHASQMAGMLKELIEDSRSPSLRLHETFSCPDEFKCPISKEMMRDPVIVASGQFAADCCSQTFDRPFIQKWLKAGNRTCPQTQQVLSHTILTPNHLVRDMISRWCKSKGIELSVPARYNEDGLTEADRGHFLLLLEKMSLTISDQKEAASELRLLTKRMPSFRALFAELTDAIPLLLNPLLKGNSENGIHTDLEEDVITTLLNLSIHDNNKKLVAENPLVIPLLIDALKSGTDETRSNAAATLFTLSALDSNKSLIGKSGALKPLIDLLEEGHPIAMKDVASAIFSLCIIHENKGRAVREGAVGVILTKIANGVHVDELLAILAMLSTHTKAVEEMGDLRAVPCLLKITRENSCGRNKENCIAILYAICMNDRTKWKEVREEEKVHRTISLLAQDGTARAKRKAGGILERLNRAVNITHTA